MASNTNNTANVMAGKFKTGGYAFRAKLGATLPKDAATALAADFKNLGFLSADGVTVSRNEESTSFTDVNGDVVLSLSTKQEVEISCTFEESLNPEVLKTVSGEDNVTVVEKSGATPTKMTVRINSKGREPGSYCFEVMQGGKNVRIMVPNGIIKEVGEVAYKGDELITYPVTISALPDENGDKVIQYIQLNDGAKA